MDGWMNTVNALLIDWLIDWLTDWLNKYVSERLDEWVREWVEGSDKEASKKMEINGQKEEISWMEQSLKP